MQEWRYYLPEYRLPRSCGCVLVFLIVLFIVASLVIFMGLPVLFEAIGQFDQSVPVFDLQVGEQTIILDGITIRLLGVLNDGRCVSGSDCSTESHVQIQIEVLYPDDTDTSGSGQTYLLTFDSVSMVSNSIILPDAYVLRVIQVYPETIPVSGMAYVVRFQAFQPPS